MERKPKIGRIVVGIKTDESMFEPPVIYQFEPETFERIKAEEKKVLQNDIITWMAVYKINAQGKYANLTDIFKTLEKIMSKGDVVNSLMTLGDWGVIDTTYGPTGKDTAGRLYWMRDSYWLARDAYEKFMRDREPEQARTTYDLEKFKMFPIA